MPPKKSKKKSAKGNNENLDGMQIALPEERIKYLESQTQALEMQLAYRSEATANAVAECESIREELAHATKKYEDEKKLHNDVTRSMTRQYKGMQEDLLKKITEREETVESLKDELETSKRVHKEQIEKKGSIIHRKEAEAEERRVETEKMCKHFADLLADARLKIVNHTQASAERSRPTAAA